MKKFKKIIAMGCAAVMAVSAMSMSAFAAETITPPTLRESYVNGQVVYTAVIAPGEILATSELRAAGIDVLPESGYTGRCYSGSFKCFEAIGSNLNVWVQNNGSHDVIATLTPPVGSDQYEYVAPGDSGETFRLKSKNGGLSGTYYLEVEDTRGDSYSINVITKARQF